MMLATICHVLPQVLISLFGGVWADRYNRKHMIMLADGFIALATLAIAISFLFGYGKLELLLAALVVRSLGAGVQSPAVKAIYPQLVPEEQLTRIQGINQTLGSILTLLAPAAGGVLLGTVGIVGAFFVDVITAAFAILVMSFIRVGKVTETSSEKSIWKDMKDGLAYTFGHRQLRRLVICYLFSFLLFTPAFVLTPLMIERTFGGEVWRLTVNEIVWASAAIVGGIFVAAKGQFRDKVRTIALCIAVFGAMFAMLGLSWNFASFLVFMGIAGFFLPMWLTAQTVYIQETTPLNVLGRVFSVVEVVGYGAVPIAILFFGPMADVVSVESLLVVTGVLLVLVGAIYGLGEKSAKGSSA
jgi:DHA3 family macrolide efflux protein-like MFS transporter